MYTVKSKQIARSIQIKACLKEIQGTLIFGDSDELFYRIGDKQYVYVFQFGIVCFFNMEQQSILNQLEKIKPFGKGEVESSLTEDFVVYIKRETSEVNFKSVTITEFNEEKIRLIMLHTSQSLALDRYSEVTESLLVEASNHTKNLEEKGKLNISKSKLKRLIGRNLTLKNGIYENLYIFDSPESTWDDEELTLLDANLKRTFDLKNRYRFIQDRINIIKENLELFKGIWDHKESSTLEWIIIILIFVEIIDLFVSKIL